MPGAGMLDLFLLLLALPGLSRAYDYGTVSLERRMDWFDKTPHFSKAACHAVKHLEPEISMHHFEKILSPGTDLIFGGAWQKLEGNELHVKGPNKTYMFFFRIETYDIPEPTISPFPTVKLYINKELAPKEKINLYNFTYPDKKAKPPSRERLSDAAEANRKIIKDWELIKEAMDLIENPKTEDKDPCPKVIIPIPMKNMQGGNVGTLSKVGSDNVVPVDGPDPTKKYFGGFVCYKPESDDLLVEVHASFVNLKQQCVLAWRFFRVRCSFNVRPVPGDVKKKPVEEHFGPTPFAIKNTIAFTIIIFLILGVQWCCDKYAEWKNSGPVPRRTRVARVDPRGHQE